MSEDKKRKCLQFNLPSLFWQTPPPWIQLRQKNRVHPRHFPFNHFPLTSICEVLLFQPLQYLKRYVLPLYYDCHCVGLNDIQAGLINNIRIYIFSSTSSILLPHGLSREVRFDPDTSCLSYFNCFLSFYGWNSDSSSLPARLFTSEFSRSSAGSFLPPSLHSPVILPIPTYLNL